jgi:hypothetical protein
MERSVRKKLIGEITLIVIALPVAAAVLVRGCRGCENAVFPEDIVGEYPSPSHKLKIVVSMWSGGAMGRSVMNASLVDGRANHSEPGCRVLSWKPGDFVVEGDPVLDVKWSDDSRVVLTYPARLPFQAISTRCQDVEVVHVVDLAERKLRGYVCLDPAAPTFQPCMESRENRWSLLGAGNARGWAKVTATLDPQWSPERAYPVCRWQMAYVEVNGIVRPRRAPRGEDAGHWDITPTEFTFAGRSPREPCPQYFDPSHDAAP